MVIRVYRFYSQTNYLEIKLLCEVCNFKIISGKLLLIEDS